MELLLPTGIKSQHVHQQSVQTGFCINMVSCLKLRIYFLLHLEDSSVLCPLLFVKLLYCQIIGVMQQVVKPYQQMTYCKRLLAAIH
ncbi:hypothetical protein LINPERPRIM_LOCUS20756 [Linum perenne]